MGATTVTHAACFNTISLLLLLRDLFFSIYCTSAASGVVVSVFLFLPL
jgi:hypothetical protein